MTDEEIQTQEPSEIVTPTPTAEPASTEEKPAETPAEPVEPVVEAPVEPTEPVAPVEPAEPT